MTLYGTCLFERLSLLLNSLNKQQPPITTLDTKKQTSTVWETTLSSFISFFYVYNLAC